MIDLPKTLEFSDGSEWAICTDYRIALSIFNAINDKETTQNEKNFVILDAIYPDYTKIPTKQRNEAYERACKFLDGIDNDEEVIEPSKNRAITNMKILDWNKDSRYIFQAINRVAGFEVRSVKYMHWWTFLGYFGEIGAECFISMLMQLRRKIAYKEKLTKEEAKYYKENKEIIDLDYCEQSKEINEEKQFLINNFL